MNNKMAAHFGLLSSLFAGAVSVADSPRPASQIFEEMAAHEFHPLDDTRFTIDREFQRQGIASLDDEDWRVRLLAVRDLILLGEDSIPEMVESLSHSDVQVRYAGATALGVLRATSAVPALEEVLRADPDPLARSQAAVALGQIESASSLERLRERLAEDDSKDVRHQCELAIDQIEKKKGATPELRAAFASLDPATFKSVRVGSPAPDFILPDTEGAPWQLTKNDEKAWTVLVWVFADWCPVCHGEFRELMALREEFKKANVRIATLEAHDIYRCRVMVGKEVDPKYWFAKESFQENYTDNIWWPHLADRAGAVGAAYGVDPMAFSVHAEYINRPATIIIDPEGIVRFAYYGTYWGDRPTIEQTLDFIRNGDFQFEHEKRLRLEKKSSSD